jgi:hypothetical protein
MQTIMTIGLDIAKSVFNPLVPSHCRMRPIDRDLIRGGHYGQRPCLPRLKAEHMAAPTNPANVKPTNAIPKNAQGYPK